VCRRSEAFERLINAFYDRVEGDELISPLFPAASAGAPPQRHPLVGQRSSGAPTAYTDQLGGYHRMVGKHRDLAITPRASVCASQP